MTHPSRYARALLVLIDGARPDVMRELLDRGELPHIARHVVARGGFCAAGGAFPSTTGPAYVPMLTGWLPGHIQLPGIRWFDRREYARTVLSLHRHRSYCGPEASYIDRDVPADTPTLFSLVPEHGSVLSAFGKGTRRGRDWSAYVRTVIYPLALATKRWDLVDRFAHWQVARHLDDDWRFIFAVFPGVDELSHHESPRAPRTLDAYRAVDRHIGDLCARLAARGRYDDTLIVITADHGLSETRHHFDIDDFVDRITGNNLYYPKVWRPRNLTAARSATMVSGNAMCHVYLRHAGGWEHVHRADELTEHPVLTGLLAQEAVDVVAARDGRGVARVWSRRGAARIREDHRGAVFYQPLDGGDPLEYGGARTWTSARACLADTLDSEFPDAPVQLLQVLSTHRAGDLVVSATRGHDLRNSKYEVQPHSSSHGSLRWDQIKVPLVSSHPMRAGAWRTADVFPTILELLGVAVPASDGHSFAGERLAPARRHAGDAS